MKRAALGALLVLVTGYLAVCGYMFVQQRALQYRPDPTRSAPAAAGLDRAQEINLRSGDTETLIAWWVPPRGETQPVYLYLHGNAGNLARRAARFARMTDSGAGLFAVAYRGYAGSTGKPSEAGFHTDALTAYNWVARSIDPSRIVIFGESIGTGVAVPLAGSKAAAALVLDAPFDSARDIAQRRYPWLPISLLMLDQFRSDLIAPRIALPVFIAHCREDRTVPFASAAQLARRFKTPVQFETYDSACHPAPYHRFMPAVESFLSRLGLPRS